LYVFFLFLFVHSDDEENPTLELKIFFNKTCYPGIYLNPEKIAQIAPHTPQEKPAQALKYLIERLIEVSVNKEKFLEIIEAGFGTRIFNKAKDKVVKKVNEKSSLQHIINLLS